MEYLVITIFILASLVVLALRVITGVRSKVLPSVNQAQKSPVNQSGPALRRQPKIKQLALGQLAVVLFLGAIFVGGLGLNVAEVAWAAPAPPAKLSVNSMPAAIPARQESAQITGVVYLDYNADGERSDREPGEAGIIVTAYNVTGTVVASDTTVAPSGAYTLTTIPAGTAVRIEVTGLPADIQPGPIGPDSSTTVAFVTVGGAGSVEVLDLAVVRPSQYCEDNPLLVTSCYVVGDQDSDDPVIVDFPYNAGAVPGTTTDPTDFDIPSTHGITVSARIVGTTYGIAYQRTPDARRMFAGAFMHRHSGFGPGGTGAIYVTDVTSDTAGTTSILTTLSAGPDLHGTEFFTDYLELPSGNPITNTWDATGKTALGDLDISEDGETLFAVNLFDLGLYQIPTDGAGPIISDTVPVDLPGIAPGAGNACNSEDVRPFGLGVRDGLVYVGMVCTAESSQDPADLHAYIYTFDPTSRTFALTPALDFALDDNRGCTFQRSSPATCLSAIWRPWVPVFAADTAPSGDFPGELLSSYPQPMLADIEFDDDGSMILGFRDRYGDQVGYRSPSSPFTDTLYISIVGGDVLYACQDGAGGWLEPGSGGCANNYDDNYFLTHDETSMGGMVRVPGRPETVMTSFDPIPLDNQILDGGLRWYNNETGDIAQAYRLYSSNDEPVIRTFGKGNGLGDVEALCSLAPIEVGNRIWLDEDGDGIQDPGELPIGGVEVQLYRDGNLLGSATTDDDGTYYFIDVTNPISPSRESQSNYGVVNGLGPNLVYEIRVALTQTAIASYTLTASNTTDDDTNDNKTDLIDSDAVQVGSTAVISFSTGGPGANNHTLDIGLLEGELVSLGDTVWLDVNNDGVLNNGEQGISGVEVQLFDVTEPVTGTPLLTTTTSVSGTYQFTNLVPGSYVVYIPPSNFEPGGSLEGLTSSLGTTPAPDPDDNENNDDNGTPESNGGVVAEPVTLTVGLEPINDGDTDANSNLTVDFGFFGGRFDLALIKRLADNQAAIITPPTEVTFVITVTNQGTVTATNIELVDYLPEDFVLADGSWSDNGLTATQVLSLPVAGLAPGQSVSTTIVLSATSVVTNGVYTNTAEILTGTNELDLADIDSVPDDDIANDVFGGDNVTDNTADDEDDHDPAFVTVAELVSLGDTVWLDVNNDGVLNNGEQGISGVEVQLFDVTEPVTGTPLLTTTTSVSGTYQFTNLVPGSYVVYIPPSNFEPGGSLEGLTSSLGTTPAPDPDDNENNDDNGTPESNGGVVAEPVTLTVGLEPINDGDTDANSNLTVDFGFFGGRFDLALIKRLADNQAAIITPPTEVTFVITVTNQGTVTATNIELVDYLPEDFVLADGSWSDNGLTATQVLSLPVAGLAPGQSVSTTIVLSATSVVTNGVYTNTAEILTGTNELDLADIDSVPDDDIANDVFGGDNVTDNTADDEDDHDPAFVTVAELVSLGDTVWLDVNNDGVLNNGEQGISGVEVQLFDVTEPVTGTPLLTTTTSVSGTYQFTNLVPGSYVVYIPPSNFEPGGSLEGLTSSLGTTPAPDPDDNENNDDNGTPESNGGVVAEPVTLTVGLEPINDGDTDANSNLTVDFGFFGGRFDLALIKRLADNQAAIITPPTEVTFVITVTNQGTVTATNIELVDYLPEDFVLADGSWSDNGLTATQVLSLPVAGLAPGQSVSTTIVLSATSVVTNGVYTNTAEILTGTNELDLADIDSVPDDDIANDVFGGDNVTDNTADDEDDHDPAFVTVAELVSLGDTVWLDVNNDGVLNNGEQGISGVEVQLFDVTEPVTGTPLLTTTTSVSGTYQFTNLVPGSYVVYIPPSNFEPGGSLEGLTSSLGTTPAPDPDDNENNDDNGTPESNGGVVAEPVTLTVGLEPINDGDTDANSNLTVDFGFFGGRFDLALIKRLADNQAAIITPPTEVTFVITVTNQGTVTATNIELVDYLPEDFVLADGSWSDNGLTATQVLSLPVAGLAPGQSVSTTIVLSATSVVTNGVYTNTAEILTGTNELDLADIDSVPDDDIANDVFGGDNVTDNTADDEDDHDPAFVTVAELVSLGDTVWLDVNNDGVLNNGEQGISGVEVQLFDVTEPVTGTPLLTTTTSVSGTYQFTNLVPGSYVVYIPPSNFEPGGSLEGLTSSLGTTPAPDPDDNENNDDNGTPESNGGVVAEPVTLTVGLEPINDGDTDANSNLTVDFGFFGGRFDLALIKDLADDQSPTITAGELVTFTITVFNQGTVTTTNIVVVDYVPDGFTAEDSNWTGTTGTVSRTLAITLSPGLSTTTDIVLRADPALTQTGVITNFAEIAQARDEQNVIRRDVDSTPDNNPNNDGTPVDNATTDPTDEDDHDPARVTVVSNEVVSLGNLVWLDSNNNGLVDSGETGIEGVEVQLFRGTDPITAPPLSTTTTISDGTYLFENLSPGNYVVYLPASNFATGQPLAGLTSSTGNEPTPGDDNTDNDDNGAPEPNGGVVAQVVTLTPGQEPIDDGDSDANSNLTVDFGFFQPLRVGNLVWNDLNDNGFYEPGLGETGINEVVVELYQLDAQTGQPALVGTDTTASGGFYSFENLEPGTYFIRLPASNFDEPGDSLFSYVSSQPTFNPSNGVDGDDNGSGFDGGITSPTFNLVSGQTPEGEVDEDQTFPDNSSDLTIDFGVVQLLTLGNQVWFDNDGNGRIDPGEPSVPEVTVNLLNTNGQVLATTTTDRNGFYLFPGLRPGDYIVEIPATNFQGSGPLAGYVSSGGSTDPNNNIDNDDNGVDSDNPAATGVRSNPVTLTLRGEPSGGGNVNLTVDFGFEARPTFIDLLYFEAKWQGDSVVLTWATQAEIDNYAFVIWRSETGSFDDKTMVAEVGAKEQPDPDGKRTYSVQDKAAQMSKTYTYWLVDIETDGDRTDPVGDPSRTQVVAPPGTSGGDEEPIYLPVIVR